jgi:hypothetical protein
VVKEENRKISPFPHRHDRSESHAAPAIQQPVVEQEQQVQGVSAVPPSPSEGPLLSKAMDSPSRAMDSLPSKPGSSPSKGWFIGSLKGFFGLPTAYRTILTHAAT